MAIPNPISFLRSLVASICSRECRELRRKVARLSRADRRCRDAVQAMERVRQLLAETEADLRVAKRENELLAKLIEHDVSYIDARRAWSQRIEASSVPYTTGGE